MIAKNDPASSQRAAPVNKTSSGTRIEAATSGSTGPAIAALDAGWTVGTDAGAALMGPVFRVLEVSSAQPHSYSKGLGAAGAPAEGFSTRGRRVDRRAGPLRHLRPHQLQRDAR